MDNKEIKSEPIDQAEASTVKSSADADILRNLSSLNLTDQSGQIIQAAGSPAQNITPPGIGIQRATTKTLSRDSTINEILAALVESEQNKNKAGGLSDILTLGSIRSGADIIQASKGEKALLICDYLTSNINVCYSEEKKELKLSDDTTLVVGGKKKPSVDEYNTEIWTAANYRILLHLVRTGVRADVLAQYIEYSSWISDYLSMYIPKGVFRLDEQHRLRVASEGRAWNNLCDHDKSRFLVYNHKIESFTSQSKVKKSKPGKVRNRTRSDSKGRTICGNFNSSNGCSYGDKCKFAHVCSGYGCGGDHPKTDCPKVPPRFQSK